MADEREYKQQCDNPAILSAVKASSCEMSARQGRIHLSGECGSRTEPVPSHLGTSDTTTGSSINNRQYNLWDRWLDFTAGDLEALPHRHFVIPALFV